MRTMTMVGSDDRIVGTEFSAALSSVILPMLFDDHSLPLPDVRDGLKPVHRNGICHASTEARPGTGGRRSRRRYTVNFPFWRCRHL